MKVRVLQFVDEEVKYDETYKYDENWSIEEIEEDIETMKAELDELVGDCIDSYEIEILD